MLKVNNLSKVFQTNEVETRAVNEVSLDVKKGEFVAIMGPSGCGKSTLLNIIGLLDSPSDGTYEFMGVDVTHYSEKQKTRLRKDNIGFVFQNFNLIDELSVYENVELPLIYQNVPSRERKERVFKALEQMQIYHRRNHFPLQLSGGQQQRVAVARAIISNPQIILADEPTGNLDSQHGEEVMNILDGLNRKGTTVIIVTHSQRDADYSRRIVRLFDGQIINEDIRERRDI